MAKPKRNAAVMPLRFDSQRDLALVARAAKAAGAPDAEAWARQVLLELAVGGKCPCCGCTKSTHRGVVVRFGDVNGKGK